jgi:hypothetical protein
LPQLASRPLFEPIAAHCRAFAQESPPGPAALEARLAQCRTRPTSGGGVPLRFALPGGSALGYEERVYRHGEVATRPHDWHDVFNALVWMSFPRTKAALNALHFEEIQRAAQRAVRSPVRDAATQFDESGLVVLSSDPELLDLLSARRWVELFWNRRADVIACMRFLVFGHGLYDALRSPFHGLCGRALLIPVEPRLVQSPVAEQVAHADEVLAMRFGQPGRCAGAKGLCPVPVLGIPGVTAASECRAYYEDRSQFRPARPASRTGQDAVPDGIQG